jgi:hypothetical protein
MNDLDLREHFEQWAAPLRTIQAPPVSALRRRTRRRRSRITATTASALAACAVIALVILVLPDGSGGGAAPSTTPESEPFVHQPYTAPRAAPYEVVYGRGGQSVRVIDAATGRVRFTGRPIGPGKPMFTAIAAGPSDRVFVLAQQNEQNRTSFDILLIGIRATWFMRAMHGASLPPGVQIYGMTVNPQDSRLALNVIGAGGVAPEQLRVYNLISGALLDDFNVSDGQLLLQYWPGKFRLAFTWIQDPSPGHHADYAGLRILDVTDKADNGTPSALITDSVPDPSKRGFAAGQFTTDGTVALKLEQVRQLEQVVESSAATGRPLHRITIGTARSVTQSPNYCSVLWASADGADLLTQCGSLQQEVVNGKATRVRLAVTVPASQVGWAGTFAW